MDLTTATHELSDATINIYPNPVNDLLYIEINRALDFTINLYNIDSRLVLSQSKANYLDLSHLPSGTYMIEIMDLRTGKHILERLIIAR